MAETNGVDVKVEQKVEATEEGEAKVEKKVEKAEEDDEDDAANGDADAGAEGAGGMSKSAKKRLKKKAAEQRKKEGAENGEGVAAPQKPAAKKSKKGLKQQTWPVPTVPVSKQFPHDAYPLGEVTEYHQDCNLFRATSEEKRELDRLANLNYNEIRRAAEVHRQVRKYIQDLVKPGMLMIDICDTLEAKVLELIEADGLKAGRAFPTGCSVNFCAAHWTPNSGDKTVLNYDDVVKFDFGTHVSGRVVDCAWTHNFNPMFDPLKAAAKAATEEGIRLAGPDARLGEIGEMISEVMSSHEVEINKKIYTVKPIENLTGHSIEPYRIHAGKSVPLVGNNEPTKMEEGEVYAIETFGSTGK
eukprot:gene977-1491_t